MTLYIIQIYLAGAACLSVCASLAVRPAIFLAACVMPIEFLLNFGVSIWAVCTTKVVFDKEWLAAASHAPAAMKWIRISNTLIAMFWIRTLILMCCACACCCGLFAACMMVLGQAA